MSDFESEDRVIEEKTILRKLKDTARDAFNYVFRGYHTFDVPL